MTPNQPYDQIISVLLNKNGELEVIKRKKSNVSYCNGEPLPDHVFKEIYACEIGTIALIATVDGIHEAAYSVRENFIFPEANAPDQGAAP